MASRSGAPETEETVVFPDFVMLDRRGHRSFHDGHAAADEAVDNDDTAAAVHTSNGHSCYISFALAAPPKVSYLNLHWPELPADKSEIHFPAYPYVLAADDNLVLLHVAISSYGGNPSDLFVYAAGPPSSSPSALRLPVPAEDVEYLVRRGKFQVGNSVIGILRLAATAAGYQDDRGYIVAHLDVSAQTKRVSPRHTTTQDNNTPGNNSPTLLVARFCVFSSETGNWRTVTKRAPGSNNNGGHQFPARWSTNDVLPLDGRFLCWVDYLKGLLLSDFSSTKTTSPPALHFVPFPGKQYADDTIREQTRSFPATYRGVSVSQGMLRFVHIDNHWYEKDEWTKCSDCLERKRQKLGTKITTWTLTMRNNMMDGGSQLKFEWEAHRVINLECLWAQIGYQDKGLPRRLPEHPLIAPDDPDVLCCLLTDGEYRGNEWMIMVDMKYAYLRASTPGADEKPYRDAFSYTTRLPSVFSKHLQNPTQN